MQMPWKMYGLWIYIEQYSHLITKLCVFLISPNHHAFVSTVGFVTNSVGVHHHHTHDRPRKRQGRKNLSVHSLSSPPCLL